MPATEKRTVRLSQNLYLEAAADTEVVQAALEWIEGETGETLSESIADLRWTVHPKSTGVSIDKKSDDPGGPCPVCRPRSRGDA